MGQRPFEFALVFGERYGYIAGSGRRFRGTQAQITAYPACRLQWPAKPAVPASRKSSAV